MRMVPVALLTLGDKALLHRLAVEQAHITHHHPLSDAACKLVGRLLHFACLGLRREQMRSLANTAALTQPRLRFDPYPGFATGYVGDTLQTVLHHFFSTRSFEECVTAVVNQGGDADTTGAIAGAIAGAYYGPQAIPSRWLKKLPSGLRAEIEMLSARLVALSPVGLGRRDEPIRDTTRVAAVPVFHRQ